MFLLERHLFSSVSLPLNGQTPTDAQLSSFFTAFFAFFGAIALITGVFGFITNTVLTGILTVTVGQGVLGRKITLSGAWQATLPRIGPLLATALLSGLFIGFGWLAAVGLAVGLALLLAEGAHLVAIGVLVGVLGFLTATVFAAIIGIRWSLALPVVMLEGRGPMASLGRSWRLVRDSAWRVLGIMLVTALIVGFVAGMIRAPFEFLGGPGAFITNMTSTSTSASTLNLSQLEPTILGTLTYALGSIIASALTAPLAAGVVVLLYADLRMRKEGIAERLQAAAAQPPGAGTGPGTADPPSPW